MKLSLVVRALAEAEGDVLVVGRYADEKRLPPALAPLDRKLGGMLSNVLKSEKFEGKPEQLSHFYTAGRIPAKAVLVAGLGKRQELDAERIRRVTAAALRRARDLGAKIVSTALLDDGLSARVRGQAIAEGALLGTYTFDRYKREKNNKAVEELRVVEPDSRNQAGAGEGLKVGEIFAAATCYARDLVNEPANHVTPTYLARMATVPARAERPKTSSWMLLPFNPVTQRRVPSPSYFATNMSRFPPGYRVEVRVWPPKSTTPEKCPAT